VQQVDQSTLSVTNSFQETPLAKAVRVAGGQAPLARKASEHHPHGKRLRQGQIWKWLQLSAEEQLRFVSAEWVRPIELAVDAEVTRYQLRPDVFGAEPARAAA
jgi:DNA-binding transcriptional regulator YdaS (Cro superfamily)